MYMRLGFAVAIHVEPDVLLVDEVLAVGEKASRTSVSTSSASSDAAGRTILLVTHSSVWSSAFATKRSGWTRSCGAHGDPKRVVDAYLTAVEHTEEQQLTTTACGRSNWRPPRGPSKPQAGQEGSSAGQAGGAGRTAGRGRRSDAPRHVPGEEGPMGIS